MNVFIIMRIVQFKGYVYESAGVLSGFFTDPAVARACGQEIERQFGAEVQVCGCQLSIWL